MSLLQIAEPDSISQPHKRNIAIGIDLGTTNSLVATIKSATPTVLHNQKLEELIPSIVYYGENNQLSVGSIAKAQQIIDPANTIVSVKRFMGRSFYDLDSRVTYPYHFAKHDGMLEIATNHGYKNPVQVSSDILKELKNIAIQNLGEEPVGAVITVPAYFDDGQRQATKLAAQLAGLTVLRLLNEPTAAAIAYGLDSKNEGTFLVYDLGGGTLDVSILRLNKGVFEVLAVHGDTHLGGDDFDQRVFCYILEKAHLTALSDKDNAIILNLAKSIKENLSTKEKVAVNQVISNGQIINLTISREEFFTITQELTQKAIKPIKKALHDAKLDVQEIDEIIMVGGSSRLLNIREQITQIFNKPLLNNIDPDKVVALGAAIQADTLVGNRKDDYLLLDVTPLSLGIETMGNLVEKIIPRNSTIPVTRAQDFTTFKDGQTAMSIHVLQGGRELVTDCRSLAKFSLKGIPPMTAGAARIRVTFQIDADGLLSVTACEQTTGISNNIEVKPSFGLDGDQIQNMLKSSIENAKLDMLDRQLAEVVVDAHALIDATSKALQNDRNLLDQEELNKIETALNDLQKQLLSNQDTVEKTKMIKQLTISLNHATEGFAARRMDRAVKTELTGKNVEKLI